MIALQNMRMSCDSTYLLDHNTDCGVKADELATLLEEIYEEPDTKVVIFSQWLRMHELLVRRFEQRDWDHVLFHGGVPGQQRRDLVDRFREDRACRAFLATDAGGVGLNLQHASVVVNMDLPWNPAVLEQRIGRVHRLGQKQPVRVVNFVAQGTIEEGMLSVLSFKKSLFAGVLDGGDKEVFLGGSRLTKFMESVQQATSSIPEAAVEDAAVAGEPPLQPVPDRTPVERIEQAQKRMKQRQAARQTAADPWSGILQSGMALLEQFSARGRSATPGVSLVRRDETTGEEYVRLPLPKPEVLQTLMKALGSLLEGMRT
jgi:superfamily II DNA/RNA helicase